MSLTTASAIADNYRAVLDGIAHSCARVGRSPAEVTVVAVSKTVGVDEVARAIEAGIHDFGENRTVPFNEKRTAFPRERWHFIGSIQTNKIKDFVGQAALVHSVASERVLTGIAQRAQLLGIVQPLLLEVNVSGEQSKDGISPAQLPALLKLAAQLEGITVTGLMTMAPQGDAGGARAVFRGLRELRDRYAEPYKVTGRVQLRELSMGMSEDYPLAVEEGATIVRIGRSVWV
ncbi:MAG: YggS family pyridoxal phosphate-dependent enzyme [Coriobacteriales bacterium]|jgi:pyridoxal phosphate enzyme (YggS family)|nr:YggS family pyridoxal phosphate-dependent enzyme [Coriobacteriales bacterium]